jgi:hypothetical protein
MKTIGIDISLPMLRMAQKKLGQPNVLCLGKAKALSFKEKSFDCVALITREASRDSFPSEKTLWRIFGRGDFDPMHSQKNYRMKGE